MKIKREVEISLDLNELKDKLFKSTFTAAGIDYNVVKIIEEDKAVLFFAPKKEISLYYNSFVPTSEVYFTDNKMHVFCRLDKHVRVFKILWYLFCSIILFTGVVALIHGAGFAVELFLIPLGLGLFVCLLIKIGFYFSVRSFLKNLYEELGGIS